MTISGCTHSKTHLTRTHTRLPLTHSSACTPQDDVLIKSEGLDSLTVDELRAACKTRGLKAAYGEGAGTYMRKQMQVGAAVDALNALCLLVAIAWPGW